MNKISVDNVIKLIGDKNVAEIRKLLDSYNEVDIANMMDDLNENERIYLFRLLPRDVMAELFAYLEPESQEDIVKALSGSQVQQIIEDLHTDDVVDLLEEMPSNLVKKILENAPSEKRQDVNKILNFADDTAGSLMTTEYIELKRDITCKQALAVIRSQSKEMDVTSNCFVINGKRELLGLIRLSTIVFSPETSTIEEIFEDNIVSANAHDDVSDVIDAFKKYDLNVMPVVNDDNCLIGIITVDDVIDVMDDEVTDEIHKMGAVIPLEDSYIKTGVLQMASKRVPWLLFLMISATFTGLIITGYEHTLAQVAVLSAFIPMLMDTAGNCGSQASTVVIRGLALGEINKNDIGKILWKELRVGLLTGTVLGLVNFVVRTIMPLAGADTTVLLVVTITLLATAVVATSLGCTLPILAKMCKQDPAMMAGPLVTTIADAIALMIYFASATAFLL